MKSKYDIWYMKPDYFKTGIMGAEYALRNGSAPKPKHLSDTHIKVHNVEADGLEQVFRVMQAEHWSPNGEAVPLIQSLGLQHTSMSVGDVIVDASGKAFMVDNRGFVLLKEGK